MIVYLITNLANGKYYVGQTQLTLEERWRRHLHDAGRRMYIGRALVKYGAENFVIEELGRAANADELDHLEGLWIRLLGSCEKGVGYNLRLAAKGHKTLSAESIEKFRQKRLGHEVSKETREKIAASVAKHIRIHGHPNAGKSLSDSHLAKLKGLKGELSSRWGKHDTSEAIERRIRSVRMASAYKHKVKRVRNSRTGVIVSQETRQKRSETMKATLAMKKLCKQYDASALLAEHAAGNYF